MKYAWGELYGAAGAIAVERKGRQGIDSVLNGNSVVGPTGRDVDLCRDHG